MLAVIDYGAGNLRSVLHALRYLNAQDVKIVEKAADLQGADKIILPGVGAFGAGMHELAKRGLDKAVIEAVHQGTPYLGICLGMQFLFEHSDEMGIHKGLGILPGRVVRFPESSELKIPHMGWNTLTMNRESALLDQIQAKDYAYFVHSYYCVPENEADILITVDYGIPFTAAVQREHVYGVQFHPEKSQQTGLTILSNYLKI
ncbi:imidazole glycerol phosphate synthase subunit HisH [Anaerolineales bacterium]